MSTPRAKARRPRPTARTVIDVNGLTLAELDTVEDLVDSGQAAGRQTAIAYVFLRRTQPDYTLEAAGRLTLRDVQIIDGGGEDDDDDTPTPGPS